MQMVIIGNIGSDAGYWYIGADGKLHHQGGWGPETLSEVSSALAIIKAAARLKTPGLADAAIKSVMGFVQKEIGAHVNGREGHVVILG